MRSRDWAAWLLVLACTFISGPFAHAQDTQRTYAVISLVGDKLQVVTYQPSTGSAMDRNRREVLNTTGGPFDKAVLMAANAAISQTDKTAKVQLFAPTDATLFDRQQQESYFNGDKADQKAVTASRILLANSSQEGTSPWEALSPAEKISTLQAMLDDEVRKAVPELLKPR